MYIYICIYTYIPIYIHIYIYIRIHTFVVHCNIKSDNTKVVVLRRAY